MTCAHEPHTCAHEPHDRAHEPHDRAHEPHDLRARASHLRARASYRAHELRTCAREPRRPARRPPRRLVRARLPAQRQLPRHQHDAGREPAQRGLHPPPRRAPAERHLVPVLPEPRSTASVVRRRGSAAARPMSTPARKPKRCAPRSVLPSPFPDPERAEQREAADEGGGDLDPAPGALRVRAVEDELRRGEQADGAEDGGGEAEPARDRPRASGGGRSRCPRCRARPRRPRRASRPPRRGAAARRRRRWCRRWRCRGRACRRRAG